ncbi:MAG: hypothetical protein K2G88_00720 [Oscillospiraceae bacterium]|nr:hypothetical protein [Oscillospiraceae bacterium]MDE6003894.1 hypothetical protein [Oscillospiraceae bacterium]MDE6657155.1 hypothetical protein [Oscillospiraceae bacterium]
MQEDLHQELYFAIICTVILDVIIWIVSLLIVKFQIAVILGLILGSIGMIINLCLLRRTILNAVRFGKTKDIIGYLLRCLIASVIIAMSLIFSYVNTVTAVLPFLYPKIIFGILSVRNNPIKRK